MKKRNLLKKNVTVMIVMLVMMATVCLNTMRANASSSEFVWPVGGDGGKDLKNYPAYSSGKYHSGLDISAPKGTPVYSTYDGIVDTVRSLTNSYGKHIIIKCNVKNKTVYMYYCHLNSFNVEKGQAVKKGEKIGTVGSTGNSTGPHLHYEVRNASKHYGNINNPTLNPYDYLPSNKNSTSSTTDSTNNPTTDTSVGKPSIDNVKILDISSKTMKFTFDVNSSTKLVRIVTINKKTGQESKQDFYPEQARNYTLDLNFNEQEGNEYYVRIYAYSQKTGSNETLHAITYGNTIGLVQLPKAEAKPSIEVGSYTECTPSAEMFLDGIVEGWSIVKGSNIAKFTVWINGEELQIERLTRKDVEKAYPNHNCAGWKWIVNPADLVDGKNEYSIQVYLTNGEVREITKGVIKAKKVNLFDVDYFWNQYSQTDSKVRSIGKDKRALERYFYSEGLQKGMSPSAIINLSEYKKLNPDVAKVVGNDNKSLMNHLLRYTLNGKGEYRRLTSKFSLKAYRNKNGDLSGMTPKQLVEHYIAWGQYENRVTN